MLALWPSMFGTSTYAYVFEVWPFFAYASLIWFVFLIATTTAVVLTSAKDSVISISISHQASCYTRLRQRLLVAAQATLARADFAPTYDGASNILPAASLSREDVFGRVLEITLVDQSPLHNVETGSYRGWRGLVSSATLAQTRRTDFKDCGPDAGRLSQLGEPQFKLPMRLSSQPLWGIQP